MAKRPTYTYAVSATHTESVHTHTHDNTHGEQDIVIGTRCNETMSSPPPGLSFSLLLHLCSFVLFLTFPPPTTFSLPGRTLCKSADTDHHTNRHAVFTHTHTHTHTHLASRSSWLLLSLAAIPPHFVSKDSTGESLTHTRVHTHIHMHTHTHT